MQQIEPLFLHKRKPTWPIWRSADIITDIACMLSDIAFFFFLEINLQIKMLSDADCFSALMSFLTYNK